MKIAAPSQKQQPGQSARLKPAQMPDIPGVGDGGGAPPPAPGRDWTPTVLRAAVVLAFLMLSAGGAWWGLRLIRSKSQSPAVATEPVPDESVPAAVLNSFPPRREGPAVIATLPELAKPWSAKEFTFTDSVSRRTTSAMIVHLPGGAGDRASGYWAFSLDSPYGRCDLAYVSNLNELATRYRYPAKHPMVASTCDDTVYDPAQMGTIATGAWVRGAVVRGMGIRPPISIQIRILNGKIFADRMEE
jgi:hypothetical protein